MLQGAIFRRAFQKTFSHDLLDLVQNFRGHSSHPFIFSLVKSPGRANFFKCSRTARWRHYEAHNVPTRALYVTQNFVTLLFEPCLVCWYFVYVMPRKKKSPQNNPKKNKNQRQSGFHLHQLLSQFLCLFSFRERERERERLWSVVVECVIFFPSL